MKLLRKAIRFVREEHGQDLLEWTVALPIFLMLAAAIVLYGWYWWNQTTAAIAIHDGVYLAARRGGSIAQGEARIVEVLKAALGGYAQDYSWQLVPDIGLRSIWGQITNDKVVTLPFVGDTLFKVRASSFQRWEQFYGGPPSGWW